MQSLHLAWILRSLTSRLDALEGLGGVIDEVPSEHSGADGRKSANRSVELDRDGKELGDDEIAKRLQNKKKSSKKGKSYTIKPDIMRRIRDRTDYYWSLILDKEIHFKQEPVDVAYTTASDAALFRNTFLSSFFFKPPVVVDAYAGIGFDTVSFLYNLYYKNSQNVKRIYAIENDDDTERNERLKYNVSEFVRLQDPSLYKNVEFYLNGTEAFFKNCKYFEKEPVESIDLLYVDPPWTVPDGENSGENDEATPKELLRFMYDTIFKHLIEHDIHVRVVCIKTRFAWKECEPLMEILREHIKVPTQQFTHTTTVESTPFKNTFFFHVIKTMESEYGVYNQSDLFKFAYNTGSEHDRARFQDYHKVVQHTEDGERKIVEFKKENVYESASGDQPQAEPYRPSRDTGRV